MYTQILKLPDGFKIVCDITFATKGDLEGKILKLQDESKSYEDKKDYERQLPHLRQCSEWGNQILVSAFWLLKDFLPASNVKCATIMWCTILLHK